MHPAAPVLLFDADCSLCVHCALWLRHRDKGGRLAFTALSSDEAKDFFVRRLLTERPDSAVFVADWRNWQTADVLFQTDALIAAVATLGGSWRAVKLLKLLPAPIRNAAYRFVARNRHRLRRGETFGDITRL